MRGFGGHIAISHDVTTYPVLVIARTDNNNYKTLSRNTTQTAAINIFKIRILLNLTFRMFVHIHFQKYNRYGFWEAIDITTIGVWNLDRDNLQ